MRTKKDASHQLDILGVNHQENVNDDGKNRVHRIMSPILLVVIWIFMDASPLRDITGAVERGNATDHGRIHVVIP